MKVVALILLVAVAAVSANTYGGYNNRHNSKPSYPVASYNRPSTYSSAYNKPSSSYSSAKPTYSRPATTYNSKPAYSAHHVEEYAAPAHYKFDWAVNDDYSYVNMGQYEARDGDHTTGNYHVVLPDGRKQNVDYYVDGYSGYVADVTYEGHAASYDHKPNTYHHAGAYNTYQQQKTGYNKPRYY